MAQFTAFWYLGLDSAIQKQAHIQRRVAVDNQKAEALAKEISKKTKYPTRKKLRKRNHKKNRKRKLKA